jgi:hypothetical protein
MRRVARSAAVGSRAWETLSLERRGCPANSTHAATLGRRRKNSPPAPRRDRCLRPRRHGAAPDERRRPRRSGHNSGFAHRWPRTLQSRGAGDPRHPLQRALRFGCLRLARWVHPAGRRAGRARTVPVPRAPAQSARTIRLRMDVEAFRPTSATSALQEPGLCNAPLQGSELARIRAASVQDAESGGCVSAPSRSACASTHPRP